MSARWWSGINFHYFHSLEHPRCQGSLSETQFRRLLEKISKVYEIIPPEEYCYLRSIYPEKINNKVFLSFDGGIRSQYEIAFPILEEYGIKALWFPCTCVFQGKPVEVEVFHHFRFSCYDSIEEFYQSFFDCFFKMDEKELTFEDLRQLVEKNEYYSWGPYYTIYDRMFKYTRDFLLGSDKYRILVQKMMVQKKYLPEMNYYKLWYNTREMINMIKSGHTIGSHSHTHPNKLELLSDEQQWMEYKNSRDLLWKLTGIHPQHMSHPSNSFSAQTLELLKELGYKYGFVSGSSTFQSLLTIQRIDHTQLISNLGLNLADGD